MNRVGCQAVIAGGPAPTGIGYIRMNLVGQSAAIASRLTPTIDRVDLHESDWLSGRHRWQASFHRIEYSRMNGVG